jgi:hypothetical protein
MNVPATIAADQAIAKQSFALSTIKANAEADQAIAGILEQASRSAPISSSRGTNVNTSA